MTELTNKYAFHLSIAHASKHSTYFLLARAGDMMCMLGWRTLACPICTVYSQMRARMTCISPSHT